MRISRACSASWSCRPAVLQARGVRGILRRATGGASRPSKAAAALVQAVQTLQSTLLEAIDRAYGDEAPAMIRTRYVTKG